MVGRMHVWGIHPCCLMHGRRCRAVCTAAVAVNPGWSLVLGIRPCCLMQRRRCRAVCRAAVAVNHGPPMPSPMHLPVGLSLRACMGGASPASSRPCMQGGAFASPSCPCMHGRESAHATSCMDPCMPPAPPHTPAWAHAGPPPPHLHTWQLDLVFGYQAAQSTNVVVLLSARGAQVGDALVQRFEGLPGKRLSAGWLRHLALLRTTPCQPSIRIRNLTQFQVRVERSIETS